MREKLFGPMKPLNWEEYLEIYDKTGVDIDGRKEFFVSSLLDENKTERANEHFIKFMKDVPGFRELCLDDQIGLAKGMNGFSFKFCLPIW